MARIHDTVQKERVHFDRMIDELTQDGKLLYPGWLLFRAAQQFPDKIAIIFGSESITYRELFARASLFSDVLKKQGVMRRDRILLFIENSPHFYISYFAAWQIGAIVVPTNIFLGKRELTHIIEDAKPKLVITQVDKKTLVIHDHILTEEHLPPCPSGYTGYTKDQLARLDQDELCALLYTSGTTGVPKGVMLSAENIIYNMAQGISRIPISDNERTLALLPLFHTLVQNTCVWAALLVGCTVILISKITRKHILDGLNHKPTIFLGVPAIYGLLCLLKTAPLDSVNLFVSGGDALPDKVRIFFAMLYRRKICNGYGLTEASPFISLDMDDDLAPTATVGRPFVGIDVQIRSEDGALRSQGEIGRLWVRGKNVMLGYYNAKEETEKMIKNSWLDTGDMAYLDKQGRIVIAGRLKDLIINKGFNIYPQEIENILTSHPNVMRAAVLGRKVDSEGEVPVAFVQLKEPDDRAAEILEVWCVQNLASYKIPKEFICSTEDLPMTPTGKIDKKALRIKL